LITGANTGIGRATALELGKAGATLFLAGRSLERTAHVLQAIRAGGNADVSFLPLVLEDLSSVRACAKAFLDTGYRLDVLINNAGLAGKKGLTKDGFELTFGVNHLGPFLLTELLAPRLVESARGRREPGRIVNLSSLAHYRARGIDWGALRRRTQHLTGQVEYRVSKLCNVLHAKELGRRLAAQGVHSYSLHPGIVASEIWREIPWPVRPLLTRFMISNEQGAETSLFCATAPEAASQTGLYYDRCRAVEPSVLARDEMLAGELYERSLRWTGLA
jgi:NAD(P)-dependent dehydrogenase (short-subunit alcohol dehydrogenase family)